MKREEQSLLREYMEAALIAVVIALLVRTFVISAYKVPTAAMVPTLKIGDCIFTWKLPYGLRIPLTSVLLTTPQTPHRGDVVVFRSPEDRRVSLVKRVVGIAGDKVEIRKSVLYINDEKANYTELSTTSSDETALRDFYSFYTEEVFGHHHRVMFRHGQDDDSFGPQVVPNGRFFVLSDNRDSLEDSRSWGMVPLENLEGRAFMIWLSLDWSKRSDQNGMPKVRRDRLLTAIN